ncbi:hypothetical protein L2E82_08775 [Cichorium intybus]|uniref:Uncharacterized protein n=1 Tax=Cichorium intybus TaxID=13427 RepID=A0ACB9G6Q3_CICIN|nr:hypothetical protein L2E82_08775 [Cichorium intybus]
MLNWLWLGKNKLFVRVARYERERQQNFKARTLEGRSCVTDVSTRRVGVSFADIVKRKNEQPERVRNTEEKISERNTTHQSKTSHLELINESVDVIIGSQSFKIRVFEVNNAVVNFKEKVQVRNNRGVERDELISSDDDDDEDDEFNSSEESDSDHLSDEEVEGPGDRYVKFKFKKVRQE